MKYSTQLNYQKRLFRVLDYIYTHLEQELDTETLADIACLSPYHFHRIFRVMVGEPVNSLIRKARLLRAAADLSKSQDSISTIAHRYTYQSDEAFNRAFSKYFKISPGQYRKRHHLTPSFATQTSLLKLGALSPQLKIKEYNHMYPVEKISVPQLHLIGIKHSGDYMNIGQAFEKIDVFARAHNLFNEHTRSFGIYYDDPATVEIDKLRSMACLSVPDADINIDDPDIEVLTIPASSAATILYKGDYSGLEQPYSWFFGNWLPESGLEAKDFPPFEEYLNDPADTPPSELLTRIHCLLESE